MCGIEPVWASEVEPYPIAVTRSRFPTMKHLGDISKINGAEIEPVDIITFGSPCQDLSVAGKRAGLEGERSGLFMEAVRIIKEMREATDGKYPRYALWENVPGAFSSNKGEDFRVVLEELIKIAEPTAVMPPVPPFGWAYADSYVGDGWSLAYRVLDTQYWPRTPQRRRRIYLVADFGGQCAREILFEREGLRGYFAKGGTPWEGTASHAEDSVGAADREGNCVSVLNPWDSQGNQVQDGTGSNVYPTLRGCGGAGYQAGYVLAHHGESIPYTLKIRSGCEGGGKGALIQTDKSATLSTLNDQYLFQPIAVATQQGGAEISEEGICPTVTAAAGMSGNNQPWVVYNGENITNPLNKANPQPGDPCHTLGTDSRNYLVQAYGISSYDSNAMKSANPLSGIYEAETSRTLDLNGGNPSCNQGGIAIVQQTGIIDNIGGQAEYGKVSEVNGTLRAGAQGAIAVAQSVAYSMETFHCTTEEEKTQTLKARDWKDPHVVAYGVDCRNMNEYPDLYPTLQAKPNGGQSLNFSGAVRDRYIVRRLTPTECARLQGFPDTWGHPDKKDSLGDEEYEFWQEVRNTHASINGKAVKDYTKAQMEKWYNKLHSDSAEYKMWGNGIALPTALYVMQGIADGLLGSTASAGR